MDENDLRNLAELLERRRATSGIRRWFVVLRRPESRSSTIKTQQITPIRRRTGAAPASAAWA